jgi:hypothetical protein
MFFSNSSRLAGIALAKAVDAAIVRQESTADVQEVKTDRSDFWKNPEWQQLRFG